LQKKLAGQLVIRGDEQATVTVRLEPWATVTTGEEIVLFTLAESPHFREIKKK
jgi:hypothetical protein